MKTNKLRKALKKLFEECLGSVYFSQAKKDTTFPFCVFEFNIISDENYSLYNVEINVWDRGNDISNLEDICDKLESLDRRIYNDEDLNFVMYFENRNIIQETDKELKRRRITFSLKLYKKEE